MNYSALIFEPFFSSDVLKNFEPLMSSFVHDAQCQQIVISCSGEWMMKLVDQPYVKTMYVQMLEDRNAALIHALKAVSQDDVLIVGLKEKVDDSAIQMVVKTLEKMPSVIWNSNLQGYDTRLLMFCMQKALDTRLVMHTYSDAVAQLADTPITYLND